MASNLKGSSGSMAVDRDRLKWAESVPTGVASGTTGVRAKAAIPLQAKSPSLAGACIS